MKILKLEILNLASLDNPEGEVINFEEGALGDTSIFSIVGPTGSGKSTLLDAICLALYNRAPRYPKKKGEKNQNIEIYGSEDEAEKNRLAPTDGRNILTRGRKRGYSKLTFLANNGNVYRAEWHVEFSVKNYKNAETFLYRLEQHGKDIVEVADDWKNLPQIIGLDYEQFLRTVLIAQGSFANFLNAKENERYELLEKLIGCEETYTTIAHEIKARRDTALERLNEVNASVEAFRQNVLPEEELQQLNENIATLEEKAKLIADKLKAVENDIRWYTDEKQLQQNINSRKEDEGKAVAALDGIKEKTARLKLHDAILQAMNLRREQRTLEESIAAKHRALDTLQKQITEKENAIKAGTELKKKLEEKATEAQTEQETAAPHIKKARELQTRIDSANQTLQEKKAAAKTATKSSHDADEAVKQNQQDIAKAKDAKGKAEQEQKKLENDIQKRKQELEDAEAKAITALDEEKKKIEGMDADKLQAEKDKATTTLADLNSGIEQVTQINTINGELKKNDSRQEELAKENERLNGQIAKLTIDDLTALVEGLQTNYTLMTSKDWEQHRGLLADGKPCPLCGSIHHPYAGDQQKVIADTSAQKIVLDEKKALLKEQKENEKEWSGALKKNEGELGSLQTEKKKKEKELEGYESKWAKLAEKHPDWSKDIDALNGLVEPYTHAKDERTKALAEFNKIQKKVTQLTTAKDKATADKADYGQEASTKMEKVREAVTNATSTLTRYQALTDNLLQQQKDKKQEMNKAVSEESAAANKVANLEKEFNAELGGKNPDEEERRLADNKKTADNKVKEQDDAIGKLKVELEGKKGSYKTTKDQMQSDEKEKSARGNDLSNWLTDYNSSHDQAVSVEQVDEMLDAPDDWEEIRTDKERKQRALASAESLRKDAEKKFAEHQQSQPAKSLEELSAEKVALSDNNIQSELVDEKAKRQRHEEALKQMGDKAEELKTARQDNEDWQEITDAIGGGDGKLLRKIAQCYTLRFLIEHANEEIRKFNSRYELMQVKNSLGIRVIDHDRADDIRDTTSLSGGETFIVSLGLALGLSALSSRNISFDNLFIDEGFGTLDPDTLATVIDSLAMLQTSQGKKVGVISHTDTMSERITTQIRVIKNGNSGSSHIEIYPSY